MAIAQYRLGFFNARMEQRMNELGLSARQVAGRVGGTYEHIRKIIRGDCLPSNALLEKLCVALELKKGEMATRVEKDKMIFKYGDAAWEFLGINPRLGPLCILLPLAKPGQREYLLGMVRAAAKFNLAKTSRR